MRRSRLIQAFLWAIAATLALAPVAGASHKSGIHIGSVHEAAATEKFCVQEGDYTGFRTAMTNIRNALYQPSWDARAWDPVYGQNKVLFEEHDIDQCVALPERPSLWIEYWLYSDNSANCRYPDATVSCVNLLNPYQGPYGHTEFGLGKVFLYGPVTVNNTFPGYKHQVNHETGHVVGLADGDGTCPGSIMHSAAYGCPGNYPDYPNSSDITTEVNVANNQ